MKPDSKIEVRRSASVLLMLTTDSNLTWLAAHETQLWGILCIRPLRYHFCKMHVLTNVQETTGFLCV